MCTQTQTFYSAKPHSWHCKVLYREANKTQNLFMASMGQNKMITEKKAWYDLQLFLITKLYHTKQSENFRLPPYACSGGGGSGKNVLKIKARGSATNASTLSTISGDWLPELLLHKLCLLLPYIMSPTLLQQTAADLTSANTAVRQALLN